MGYLKTNLSIEPLQTLNCVQCLLRSIFKTNTATLEPLDLPTPTHGNSGTYKKRNL